jgi:hypothetical protein
VNEVYVHYVNTAWMWFAFFAFLLLSFVVVGVYMLLKGNARWREEKEEGRNHMTEQTCGLYGGSAVIAGVVVGFLAAACHYLAKALFPLAGVV